MTAQTAFALIPWWAKAGASALLVLFLVGECHARDKAIANAALWQTHWSESVAASKVNDSVLNAASDSLTLMLSNARLETKSFRLQLAQAKRDGSKVIVVEPPGKDTAVKDTVAHRDTILVAELPIVKACTNSLYVDSIALSSCETFRKFAQKKFLSDSAALKLAFRKPQGSTVRTFTYGVAAGATLLLLLHAFVK